MNILHVFCLPFGMLSLRSFRLVSNSTSSYLCILSTGINGMHHHTQFSHVSLVSKNKKKTKKQKKKYVCTISVGCGSGKRIRELLFQGQICNFSSRCTSKVFPKTAQTGISSCSNTWHYLRVWTIHCGVSLHILWVVSELFPRRMVFRI